jgi:hypothetical protein
VSLSPLFHCSLPPLPTFSLRVSLSFSVSLSSVSLSLPVLSQQFTPPTRTRAVSNPFSSPPHASSQHTDAFLATWESDEVLSSHLFIYQDDEKGQGLLKQRADLLTSSQYDRGCLAYRLIRSPLTSLCLCVSFLINPPSPSSVTINSGTVSK